MPEVNPCFRPYKDVHRGKSAAVMGCGPTLSLYDGTKDIIHIGCNELIYSPEYSLDYYFIGDSQVAWPDKNKTFHKDPESYNNYTANVAKFVRDHPQDECSIIKSNKGREVDHSIHYQVGPPGITYGQFSASRQTDFQKNIVDNYMYSRISISWEMMQFALWTGVTRIYLMGHDCSYANGTVHNPHVRNYGGVPRVGLVQKWLELKWWMNDNYPEVEVMCVNPDAMNHYKKVSIDDIVEN